MVKLFASEEEMNESTNNNEGDLAVVYGVKLTPITTNTIVNTVSFPKQVTLSEAVTSEINGLFTYDEDPPEAVQPELWQYLVLLTPTEYKVYRENINTIVQYTSTDGITYTRVTELDNDEYTFDLVNRWYTSWDNTILDNFCTSQTYQFGGIFKYSAGQRDINYLEMYGNVVVTNPQEFTADTYSLELTKIRTIIDKIYEDTNIYRTYLVVKIDNNIYLYNYPDNLGMPGVIVYGSDYYRICSTGRL